MKTSHKLITAGATALFAAVLAVQAQSTTSTKQQDQQRPPSSADSSAVAPGSSTTGSPTGGDTTWRSIQSSGQDQNRGSAAGSTSGSSTPGRTGVSARGSIDTSSDRPASGSSSSTSANTGTTGSTASQVGTQANTTETRTSQQNTVVTAQADAEVTTVIQQIDAQGPVVVERISTAFVDSACNEANARALVEALHTGGSVTLRGDDGKTATFNVSQQLGYGEAFIALSLAEEALRQAGITGCATPEQWQAVLIGGELKGGTITSSTTTTTGRFPGVLVLRQQHGGWGQVAQTTNVQLGTVVASAQSSLNIEAPTSNLPPRSGYGDEADKAKADADKAEAEKNPKASPRGQEKGQMKGYDADKPKDHSGRMTPRSDMTGSSSSSSTGATSGSSTDTEDPEGKRDAKKGQPDNPPRGY